MTTLPFLLNKSCGFLLKMMQNDSLIISGVRCGMPAHLSLRNFSRYFYPFFGPEGQGCDYEIVDIGFDTTLESEPNDKDSPWSFNLLQDRCEVRRRNKHGHTLWRISCDLKFRTFTIKWNRELFDSFFTSFEHAMSGDVSAVILGLHLSTKYGLVSHGAGISFDGEGVLFLGSSGVGKSTISGILSQKGAVVLTDERPIVREWISSTSERSGLFKIYGSPWPSSGGFAVNDEVQLSKIYFLSHGPDNEVVNVTAKKAVLRMIQAVTIPWHNPKLFDPCVRTIEHLLANVPAAVLSFRPDEEVVDVIRQDLATERVIV